MLLRASSLFAAALFAFFATLQLNDPDPAVWATLYFAAAVVSAGAVFRPLPWQLTAAFAAVGVAWALTKVPIVLREKPPLSEVIGSPMRMVHGGVEEAREALGLLLVAGWMVTLTLTRARGTHAKVLR